LTYPVFQRLNDPNADIVAMVVNVLPWDNYLKGALPEGVNGIFCVLHNSFGQVYTYVINGNSVEFLGAEDHHDTAYNSFEFTIDIDEIIVQKTDGNHTAALDVGAYRYWLTVYPSSEFESEYQSNLPMIFAIVACVGFVLMAFTFVLYDWMVIRKNRKIMDAAARSNAILSVSSQKFYSHHGIDCSI
jgi:hypothetical protein